MIEGMKYAKYRKNSKNCYVIEHHETTRDAHR